MGWMRPLVAVGAAMAVLAPAQVSAARNHVFTVYLAPSASGGSDRNDGLSPARPVRTLARAQQVMTHADPGTDVVVRIRPGTYAQAETDWTFYVPGHTISFMPAGYLHGRRRPPVQQPVFTGTGKTTAWWFKALLPANRHDPLYPGGATRLRFYDLRVQNYTGGISFDGQTGRRHTNNDKPPMYVKPSKGVNGNVVIGMAFARLGDAYSPGTGFGAVLLTDSSANRIEGNTFDHIENTRGPTLIHSLYVTHFSSFNEVRRNRFTTVSGEAVKVRDRSDANEVVANVFDATGGWSAYRDQFCDRACATGHPSTSRQCASYDNRFFFNAIGTVYRGTRLQAAWSLDPPGLGYAGGDGCIIPPGRQRLYAGANTYPAGSQPPANPPVTPETDDDPADLSPLISGAPKAG